jgi:hypothetical protein
MTRGHRCGFWSSESVGAAAMDGAWLCVVGLQSHARMQHGDYSAVLTPAGQGPWNLGVMMSTRE